MLGPTTLENRRYQAAKYQAAALEVFKILKGFKRIN